MCATSYFHLILLGFILVVLIYNVYKLLKLFIIKYYLFLFHYFYVRVTVHRNKFICNNTN